MASPTRTPSLPGAHHLPQDLIASILPQADRLHLAATCRTLRAASLRWFPEVHAQLTPGDVSAAEALAAWLRRYRARARLTLVKPPQAGAPGADALSAMLRPLAACPAAAGCIASLTAAGGTPGTQLPTHCLAPFRSLECLDFPRNMFRLRGSIEPLWQLHGLRRLRISCWGLAGAWTGMSRLSKLESLRLSEQSTSAVMGALPVLGCLTELGIVHGGEEPVDWSLLTALGRLQSLSLQLETKGNVAAALPTLARTLHDLALTAEDLAAVPPELAACTGLIRLDLSNYPDDAPPVPELAGFEVASLSHLAPLAHLQHLSMSVVEPDCTTVPAVLGALTALTHLSLGDTFQEGWEHLRPLQHLGELLLAHAHVPAESAAELAGILSALPALRTLSLEGPDLLEGSWEDVWPALVQATQLQALNLDWSLATPLPAQISRLQGLTRLSLCRCREEDLAKAIASLEHLRPLAGTLADLDLSHWGLIEVPSLLTTLTSLTRLNLSHNRIAGGWEQLEGLPLLSELGSEGQQPHG